MDKQWCSLHYTENKEEPEGVCWIKTDNTMDKKWCSLHYTEN
jgi:hypothetical protein